MAGGLRGLPDPRQFFFGAGDSGQTPRKEPRKEIRKDFLFTRLQKEFDKIFFLLLSRKEKHEINFLENSWAFIRTVDSGVPSVGKASGLFYPLIPPLWAKRKRV
jgi:hypothetical protein